MSGRFYAYSDNYVAGLERENDLLREEKEALREELAKGHEAHCPLREDLLEAQDAVAALCRDRDSLEEQVRQLKADLIAAQNKGDISHVIKESEGKGLILHHNGYTLLVPEVKKVDIETASERPEGEHRLLAYPFYNPKVVNRVVVEW